MSKKSILKPITILFSFGLMGLFIAYRQGVFDAEIKSDGTQPESKAGIDYSLTGHPGAEKKQQLMPSSKFISIPKEQPNYSNPELPVVKNTGDLEISAEQIHMMSSSKTSLILDPSDLQQIQSTMPVTKLDSLKRQQNRP